MWGGTKYLLKQDREKRLPANSPLFCGASLDVPAMRSMAARHLPLVIRNDWAPGTAGSAIHYSLKDWCNEQFCRD
jgi:hypothetical protein